MQCGVKVFMSSHHLYGGVESLADIFSAKRSISSARVSSSPEIDGIRKRFFVF